MFDHIEAGIMSDLNRSQVMVKMILSLQELITKSQRAVTRLTIPILNASHILVQLVVLKLYKVVEEAAKRYKIRM